MTEVVLVGFPQIITDEGPNRQLAADIGDVETLDPAWRSVQVQCLLHGLAEVVPGLALFFLFFKSLQGISGGERDQLPAVPLLGNLDDDSAGAQVVQMLLEQVEIERLEGEKDLLRDDGIDVV